MSAGRSKPRPNAARPSGSSARSAKPGNRRKNREIERTDYWKQEIAIMTKHLDKPPRKAPRARIKRAQKGLSRRSCAAAKAEWSPERRARQAELIRALQPWKKSTGPRTKEGKARSASNALKHGFRSRAFIERVREERQLIRDAGTIIAVAKLVLGLRSAQTRGTILRTVEARSIPIPHMTVWTGNSEVDGAPGAPGGGPP